MSAKIGSYSESHLLKVAKDKVEEKTKNSVLLDAGAEARIPKFLMKELNIGKVLGRGGFCVVNQVERITLAVTEDTESNVLSGDEHFIHNVVQDRGFMARHCIRTKNKKKDYRYAIKRVQDKSKKDPQDYVNAVIDLATEARFLAVVRHANIIKMRATEDASPYTSGYFLVLDKLFDIMPTRLKIWKKKEGGSLKKMLKSKDSQKALWMERLSVAYDLACALSYLHGMRVIYRDLKADNIGFDVRDDVKIFDFGLAKELDPKLKNDDGTYKLTGDTGSPRYMAPEVYLGKPYNETADTYSFGILFWQMLALDTPYDHIKTDSMFKKSVVTGGVRPKVKDDWGDEVTGILAECFVDNPKRPSMSDICDRLRRENNRYSDTDFDEYLDESRRSRLSNASGAD